MSLIDDMSSKCCFLVRTKVPDGEGGFTTGAWTEGDTFTAAIVEDSTAELQAGQKYEVKSTFTVTTSCSVTLKKDDKIKRMSDGKCFRITSDAGDKQAPSCSTLDINQVYAEKWEVTE